MVDQVKYASLDPSTFVEGGGGILNDVNATIIKARFAMFDYMGKQEPTPAIQLTLQPEEGEEQEQAWSLGSTQDWRPSEDGRYILMINPNKTDAKLNKNSNGGILLTSMVEKGVPVVLLAGDITKLEGMKCHWVQIPDTRNLTKGKRTGKDGKQYDKTILVVSALVSLPTGSATAASPAGAAAASVSSAASDVTESAVGTLTQLVLEAGDAFAKKDLAGKAMAALEGNAKKTQILQVMFKDEFIKANFKFENGIISMKA
jgi:hypothetical protein